MSTVREAEVNTAMDTAPARKIESLDHLEEKVRKRQLQCVSLYIRTTRVSPFISRLHPPQIQQVPEAKKVKTAAVTTTTDSGKPVDGVGQELTSKDYYFDSYSHFGKN